MKEIQYLEPHQIDRAKWDRCIANASNGLVYGYSDFLDTMAAPWAALVRNDYEAVMPLPFRKKYGIHYLYQPFLTAQLGVFGNQIEAGDVQDFLKSVPSYFRLWEFSLNSGNLFSLPGYNLFERANYVLDLSASYKEIRKNYRENIKRNVRKSEQYGAVPAKDIEIEKVIALANMQHEDAAGYRNFEKLFNLYKSKGKGTCYGVYSKSGELLASAAFLFSHDRAYYLLVGNHPNGRTLGASHALIDYFIRDHAGSRLLLDFEGSDIRNLAFFYSSFGAKEERYPAIRMNRLPWYARIFKRS